MRHALVDCIPTESMSQNEGRARSHNTRSLGRLRPRASSDMATMYVDPMHLQLYYETNPVPISGGGTVRGDIQRRGNR